jgi:hypothetical protein
MLQVCLNNFGRRRLCPLSTFLNHPADFSYYYLAYQPQTYGNDGVVGMLGMSQRSQIDAPSISLAAALSRLFKSPVKAAEIAGEICGCR